jgi:3-oxoacyl-[acyl-carrier protein] reductase
LLRGKSVVVTGGSGGIGSAIARRCAAEGARVGVHYHAKREVAEALARELGGVALGFDVRDTAGIERGIQHFTADGAGLDGWVNAAGVHVAALLVSADEAALSAPISVNLLGTILCTRGILPHFLRQRAGVVLNVSSVSAVSPVPGGAAYAASKAGIEAFTRATALEYGRKGIRAVCVRPGPTETAMLSGALALGGDQAKERTALRQLGEPSDVASLVAYLLSDQARFITGSVHAVDGGFA